MITLVALLLVGAGCFGLVPRQAFGEAQLLATAWATSVALVVGLGIAATRVWKTAGAFVPLATAARVGGRSPWRCSWGRAFRGWGRC